jgi:hypothetical protein
LRLPESAAVQNHVGVARNNQALRGRGGGGAENVNLARRCLPLRSRNRMSLLAGILKHLEVGISTRQLINAGDDDLELNPELRENLPPLRRPRR